MRDELIPKFLRVARQHLHAFGWQTSLNQNLPQPQHRKRALLRQLYDDGVSRSQSPGNFVREQLGRIVEWNDPNHDPEWMADRVSDHVLKARNGIHRNGLATHPFRLF